MSENRILVSIPVINEKKNLERLLPKLMEYPSLTLFIVDDNSNDRTVELITSLQQTFNARIIYVRRERKLGFASAHIMAMRHFIEASTFDSFLQMDADLSHRIEDLDSILIHTKSADLVVGSRYIEGGRVIGWPRKRFWLSRSANMLANYRFGFSVKDATSGYRLMSHSLVSLVLKQENRVEGYVFQIQNVALANDFCLNVMEVPITFVEREFGKSKLNWGIILEALMFVLFKSKNLKWNS